MVSRDNTSDSRAVRVVAALSFLGLVGTGIGFVWSEHQALTRHVAGLEERLEAVEARATLTETRLDACHVTMAEWDRWLEIREAHWGTAWFIQSARAN